MSGPVNVDIPHRLGAAEARRRIDANIGGLTDRLPAGAQMRSAWQGDTLRLGIGVMGQEVTAEIEVQESLVRLTVMLPPALAFFGKAIEAGLRRGAPELLDDRSKKKP
jgi:hypothetical protein